MARGNSRTGANPDRVMAAVADLLHLEHAPPVVDAAAEELDRALPADLMEDPERTRAILARLGRR